MLMIPSLRKARLTIVGLNSGTSADSLDMAVMRISRKGSLATTQFIHGKTKQFPAELSQRIHAVIQKGGSFEEVLLLHQVIGIFFGESAAAYLKELKRKKITVDCIASHGQTLLHLPAGVKFGKHSVRATFQGGQLEEIAARTGKPVVGDFRPADIAAGGEGAPVTGAAMHRLFASPKESRMIVNIGGISNYFYFPKGKKAETMRAADCGPGNSLSDLLAQKLFNKPYDSNGRLAAQGKVSLRLLSILLAHPFYAKKLQSTGREMFGEAMAAEIVRFGKQLELTSHDLLATAAELTAVSIAKAIQPVLKRDRHIHRIYITGGGRKNQHIMSRIQYTLGEMKIQPIEALGMNGDYVEAASFAVMGEAALRNELLPMPRKNGKTIAVRLGKFVLPPTDQ